VPQAMAQFVLKIELLSHIMGTTPILEMARAYGLRPRLWLLALLAILFVWITLYTCQINYTYYLFWKLLLDVPQAGLDHQLLFGKWSPRSSRPECHGTGP